MTNPIKNPIRLVAVICVAATSIYVMLMGKKLIDILADPDWCSHALQAARISNQNFNGLTSCVDLFKIQLSSVAHVSLVYAGVIALCLLVLIVIVIAGARLEWSASETGISGKISEQTAAIATAAATAAANATAAAAAPPLAPTGPAMPEPPPGDLPHV